MNDHFAFVSYATSELVWAHRVRDVLDAVGLPAFVAEEAWRVGQPASVIVEKIRLTPMLVLTWSKAASLSDWVRHEIGAAHGANTPIVVFNLEPAVPLPEAIRGAKYADAAKDPFTALNAVQAVALARFRQLLQEHQAKAAALKAEQAKAQEAASNKFGAGLLFGGLGVLILSGMAKEDRGGRTAR